MRLYDFAPTRSIRVRWTLAELRVPYETVTVDIFKSEQRSPAFLAINPAGKLPVLVDGDRVLTESVAIVLYLAEKYPAGGLMPGDLAERAQLYRWIMFTVTELEQPLWRLRRHTFLLPEEKRFAGETTLARDDFNAMAAVLERHMEGRDFVLGERVSAADFVLAYTLEWAEAVGFLDGFSHLRRYVARMYARPGAPLRIKEAIASVMSGPR
jgi:glutathione S-transferase